MGGARSVYHLYGVGLFGGDQASKQTKIHNAPLENVKIGSKTLDNLI